VATAMSSIVNFQSVMDEAIVVTSKIYRIFIA